MTSSFGWGKCYVFHHFGLPHGGGKRTSQRSVSKFLFQCHTMPVIILPMTGW